MTSDCAIVVERLCGPIDAGYSDGYGFADGEKKWMRRLYMSRVTSGIAAGTAKRMILSGIEH